MPKRKQQKRIVRRPRRKQHSTVITKRKRTENAVKKLNALLKKAQGRKQRRKRTNQKGNGLFAVLAPLLGTVISSAIANG